MIEVHLTVRVLGSIPPEPRLLEIQVSLDFVGGFPGSRSFGRWSSARREGTGASREFQRIRPRLCRGKLVLLLVQLRFQLLKTALEKDSTVAVGGGGAGFGVPPRAWKPGYGNRS